jgi:N-formylglutamate amidohydrolase
MTDIFTFHRGSVPLLISVPHDGRSLPDDIASTMTDVGKAIPDTDWHVAKLYGFARDVGAAMIMADYSRYVVDVNRPADNANLYDGQVATGLCPRQTFDGRDIYTGTTPIDIESRVNRFWQPYHEKIAEVLSGFRQSHGFALLWDAHSIASRVPRLFDGELPILNLGTWGGRSCDPGIASDVIEIAEKSSFDTVVNARFQGGYITRHYGLPDGNVHAIQLELAQRAYMDEATGKYDDAKASRLRDTLEHMLLTFINSANRQNSRSK